MSPAEKFSLLITDLKFNQICLTLMAHWVWLSTAFWSCTASIKVKWSTYHRKWRCKGLQRSCSRSLNDHASVESTEKVKMGLWYGIYTIHNFACVSMILNSLWRKTPPCKTWMGLQVSVRLISNRQQNLDFLIICGNPEDTGMKR